MAVEWPPPSVSETGADAGFGNADGDAITASVPPARRNRRTTVLLAVLAVLVAGVHLGLGGAVLADSRWTDLSLDIILAMVAGKILLAVLGRRMLRRRHHRPPAWANLPHHRLHHKESGDA